ncbi:MAG: hypothetical protein KME20_14215 [Kaiparowitsia implicata GSE-PSE-MK54-09C]|jgi:hypothetical protein|nr:hypothetical protein [Kaiparowitsia implicata GSE-PSE-MK54-09C]
MVVTFYGQHPADGMDITPATHQLIGAVQRLKPKYSDPASLLFIDFYCQCKQGCDYLFPAPVRETVRLIDILQWFFDCVARKEPTALIQLMWKDVVGPTLGEYLADEKIEQTLWQAFEGDVSQSLADWDLERLPTGGVRLVLRELLDDIYQVEQMLG